MGDVVKINPDVNDEFIERLNSLPDIIGNDKVLAFSLSLITDNGDKYYFDGGENEILHLSLSGFVNLMMNESLQSKLESEEYIDKGTEK